jgi:tetratricopeptide (TPR) repeat protein
MAKSERRRFEPEKKGGIPAKLVQWGIVAVVVAGVGYTLYTSLSRPATETPPVPVLGEARTDPFTLGRMLGDVALDSTARSRFPAGLEPRLKSPDTLYARSQWYEALEALQPLLRKATAPESAAVYAYMGYCYYEAASLDRALREFRRSLVADSAASGIAPWSAFSAGWMFQSRSLPDSCLEFYGQVVRLLQAPAEAGTIRLKVAALNNLGVAEEARKNPTAAAAALAQALALTDSLAFPADARTVRDNLGRVSGP